MASQTYGPAAAQVPPDTLEAQTPAGQANWAAQTRADATSSAVWIHDDDSTGQRPAAEHVGSGALVRGADEQCRQLGVGEGTVARSTAAGLLGWLTGRDRDVQITAPHRSLPAIPR